MAHRYQHRLPGCRLPDCSLQDIHLGQGKLTYLW